MVFSTKPIVSGSPNDVGKQFSGIEKWKLGNRCGVYDVINYVRGSRRFNETCLCYFFFFFCKFSIWNFSIT